MTAELNNLGLLPADSPVPDAQGHFGVFGGRFVPEALIAALDELAAAYEAAKRPGGYTRVVKMSDYRIGDGGAKAVIAFIDPTEAKVAREETSAPTVS